MDNLHEETIDGVVVQLLEAYFNLPTIKVQPTAPFTWASKWKSPIYNDNRLLLKSYELRKLVVDGLEALTYLHDVKPTVIAGTSTAGIPHGYGLANRLKLPFVYIRDKPKDHGMMNRIEGIGPDEDLSGEEVLLIEDLISTGGSSVGAVQAVRDAKGSISNCFSIFSYAFPQAAAMFNGEAPFKDEESLALVCKTDSVIRYEDLIGYGIEKGHIKEKHKELLHAWSTDPEGWSNTWKANHPEK